MSYSCAVLCNDAALLSAATTPYRSDLSLSEGAPNGWGLAYYQGGEPLLRKQPKAHRDGLLDFSERAHNLRTNILLAHARGAGDAGGRSNDNTQPFRFRSWTFCHIGTLDNFSQVQRDIRASIPDFMRRNIRGTTDSEVFFHLFLAFLNDADRLDNPHATGREVAHALHSAVLYVDRLATERGGAASPYCCLATNGRILVASHARIPLSITRNSSYAHLGRGPDDRPLSYPHLKAVLLIAGRDPSGPGWERIAETAAVTVDGDLNIEYVEGSA